MDVALVNFVINVLLIVVALSLVDFILKYLFLMKYAKNMPVAPYLPLVGSAFLFIGRNVSSIVQELATQMKSSGYFWFFNKPFFLAFDPTLLKVILTHPGTSKKGYVYNFFKPVLRNSIILADDITWKHTRRGIVKAFGQKQLESFVTTFDNMTEILMKKLEQNERSTSKHLAEINERFFLDSFMSTLCDINFEYATTDMSKYLEFDYKSMIKRVTNGIMSRYLKPWLYPDIIYFNTREGKSFNEDQRALDETFMNLIVERRANLEEEKNGYFDSKKKKNVVDILIEDNMDDEDILAELKFLAGAASETTTTSLTFALNLLGCHQDIQEKVFQEVSDLLGKQQSVEYSHLLQMKYTEMVLMETLRLFPSIPLIIREAVEDIHIGQSIIPKNTQILISIAGLHRCESIWPNPMEFRPGRFAPDEVNKRSDYCFLPFSGGPKYCLGNKYAITVLKIALAKIIRKYKIESSMKSAADIELKSFIALFPPEDLLCTFSERKI